MVVPARAIHGVQIAFLTGFFFVSAQTEASSVELEVAKVASDMSGALPAKGSDGVTMLSATGNQKTLEIAIRKEGDLTNLLNIAARDTCDMPNFRRILILGGRVTYKVEGPDGRLRMAIPISGANCAEAGLPISPGEPLPEPITIQRRSSIAQSPRPTPASPPVPPASAIPRW